MPTKRHLTVLASLCLLASIAPAAETIRVMTFNLWHGGDAGKQPLSQSLKVIQAANADIVGLQETHGSAKGADRPDNARKLAELLGWHYFDQGERTAILSRFPLITNTPRRWGISVRLPSGGTAWIFNAHLMHAPYQPYQLLGIPYADGAFIKTAAEAVREARHARGAQVERLLAELKPALESGHPVFLTGDFNEPSHQDWTARAAAAGKCPLPVEFPSTLAITRAGMRDAFRNVFPDEVAHPGWTWTPTTTPDDPKDRHDRIDLIFTAGPNVTVKGCDVVGEHETFANIVVRPYPSDHRAVVAAVHIAAAASAQTKTKNVFLLTADGLRWQEIFRGAEEMPLTKQFGNSGNSNSIHANFWRETPEARREALLPFLWGTVAKRGQLWGNRDRGSDVRVSNGHNFSYPGYNEFLTGIADPRIDTNDKKLNANTNVFEWLHAQPAFHGRVAAAINWDVLPWILNAPRAGFPVWSAWDVPEGTHRLPVPDALTEMVDRSRTVWPNVVLDTFVAYAAKHALRTLKPRAMYISLGETDDWAHEGNYERYLKAAREFDRFLSELWALAQSLPEYRDTTTFFITVDHGRGPAPVAWKNHGKEIADSAYTWFAVIGPDTSPLGERDATPLVTQAQVAGTVAAFLGENFQTTNPKIAPPIPGLLSQPTP